MCSPFQDAANLSAGLEPDLFTARCVDLSDQSGPTPGQRVTQYLRSAVRRKTPVVSLRLEFTADETGCGPLRQLDLPLPDTPVRPQIVRIVPALRRPFLDYGVYDQFREIPEAEGAALSLEKSGIYLLGQLVQMTENEALAYRFIDRNVVDAMKQDLAKVDLCFGMRHPAWTRRMQAMTGSSR